MGACDEAFGVSLGETASSADLGGSSKYLNKNFEDRSGVAAESSFLGSDPAVLRFIIESSLLGSATVYN